MTDCILILDFGSQVTQLIARRVREAGVYCEIVPFTKALKAFERLEPKGIILSGGPASVTGDDTPRAPRELFGAGVPILGICYGQQALVAQLGGKVETASHREFGRASLEITGDCPLFEGVFKIGETSQVWMSHGDRVTEIPEGFRAVAKSDNSPFAAIADDDRHFYGLQFHPEVMHTAKGAEILNNFVHNIAGCGDDWTMEHFRTAKIKEIRAKVGKKHVICGLSGGVDSSVVAVLLHEAIGDQLTCVFVDHGLLRHEEARQVVELFEGHYKINLVHRDAADMFLDRLKGTVDPEEKRKIIGKTFIDVFEQEAGKIPDVAFLAQGTLYPDVIESVSFAGGPSATIKSHHNVGGLPEVMKLDLIEPLRELFKDEVRELGRELGLPGALVERHPFPGPGLAIRIPGEVTREKCDLLRKADAIYLDEIKKAGLYNEIWQAFAVLLPVKTVGVMGDERTYEYACALRAVTSTDGMTADYYGFSHEFLGRVANRIINEVKGINRMVYDITSKPPGTIEWE